MNKPLLLWDFDGVMADSTSFVFTYWQTQMHKAGHSFELSDYQATFTHKFPFEYLAENYPDVAASIKERYSAFEAAHYPKTVSAFPGFIETFKNTAPQFEHHIISSNLAQVINDWLTIHKLDHHFSSVVGRETPGYKDEKINLLLTQLKREPHEALFIGDTISDIEHAHKAGIQNIAVSWGVHSRQQLEFAKPDTICDTIETLFNTLKKNAC